MTFDQLNLTVQKFDRHFHCFGVYHDDRLIAASICIRESKYNLYNFYSAHSKESDSLSPIVYLISELYAWCQHNKIKLLDLGTSALGGKPNFSLIDFKLRLGATPSMKLTFEKELR
jgi:CelD/BcsL family acetyltransferase involved in cellulose biosynthesis